MWKSVVERQYKVSFCKIKTGRKNMKMVLACSKDEAIRKATKKILVGEVNAELVHRKPSEKQLIYAKSKGFGDIPTGIDYYTLSDMISLFEEVDSYASYDDLRYAKLYEIRLTEHPCKNKIHHWIYESIAHNKSKLIALFLFRVYKNLVSIKHKPIQMPGDLIIEVLVDSIPDQTNFYRSIYNNFPAHWLWGVGIISDYRITTMAFKEGVLLWEDYLGVSLERDKA